MPSSSGPAARRKGWLIPIGGKLTDASIFDRFIELCGRRDPLIGIIPTASEQPDMGDWYAKQFARHGVRRARSLNFQRRSDCDDRDWMAQLEDADGIFITGGNQLRLTTIIGGTPAAAILYRRFFAGMPVAGTSAGAAVMSAHMIAGGDEGPSPRAGMVMLAPGFGLAREIIIDQHFRQRDRLGRLLTALSYNPSLLGLGVDEDTAAFISPDDEIDVMGTSAVTVVDTRDVEFSSMHDAEPHDPVTLIGIRMHQLTEGARFDLRSRRAHGPNVVTLPNPAAAE
ncbi:MAG TPA: cyanophycinase [Gemmatimonadaceae bacterium]|nr:cyanophycinase [Gemmatimonadaceae bacterium]